MSDQRKPRSTFSVAFMSGVVMAATWALVMYGLVRLLSVGMGGGLAVGVVVLFLMLPAAALALGAGRATVRTLLAGATTPSPREIVKPIAARIIGFGALWLIALLGTFMVPASDMALKVQDAVTIPGG